VAEEHPAVRVRALALARLGRQFPSRCLADREDAVHEALCAALRVGKADNRRVVCGWAARRLLGTHRDKGAIRPARSPATSIASPALPLRLEHERGHFLTDPADWLDSTPEVAWVYDHDAVIDAKAAEERRRTEALARERLRRERAQDMQDRAQEARALVPLAVASCGTMRGVARALGVSLGAPSRWANPRDFSPPGAELLARLRELAGTAPHAHCGAS
jgi:hypothetical protein